MPNTLQVRIGFNVRAGNVQFDGLPASFTVAMTGANGPTPGAVSVATTGTDIDLSQLTTPGWAFLGNIGGVGEAEVVWGIWDPELSTFETVGYLKPGQFQNHQFPPEFGWEFGVGTGTIGSKTNQLRFYSRGPGAAKVFVGAFEA